MAGVLFFLFLAVPIAELAVLLAVGRRLGVPQTLAALVLVSVAGAVMAKRQGLRALRAVQERLAAGEMPGVELIDGLLVLGAAALLLTPGFLTDAVGLLLLVPLVRAGLRRVVRRRFERRLGIVGVVRSRTTIIDVDGDEPGADEPPRRELGP